MTRMEAIAKAGRGSGSFITPDLLFETVTDLWMYLQWTSLTQWFTGSGNPYFEFGYWNVNNMVMTGYSECVPAKCEGLHCYACIQTPWIGFQQINIRIIGLGKFSRNLRFTVDLWYPHLFPDLSHLFILFFAIHRKHQWRLNSFVVTWRRPSTTKGSIHSYGVPWF